MMFYSTTGAGPGFRDIGLAHNPFNALVVPRPIGWISSVSAAGVANLAPYSFFNAVSGRPANGHVLVHRGAEGRPARRTRCATSARPGNSWSTCRPPPSRRR